MIKLSAPRRMEREPAGCSLIPASSQLLPQNNIETTKKRRESCQHYSGELSRTTSSILGGTFAGLVSSSTSSEIGPGASATSWLHAGVARSKDATMTAHRKRSLGIFTRLLLLRAKAVKHHASGTLTRSIRKLSLQEFHASVCNSPAVRCLLARFSHTKLDSRFHCVDLNAGHELR